MCSNLKKSQNLGTLKGKIKTLKGAFKKRVRTLICKMRSKGVWLAHKKIQVAVVKKKKIVEREDSDQEMESDYVEEIVREHIKNKGGKKGKGKGCHDERASPNYDDEPMAQHLERRRKSVW